MKGEKFKVGERVTSCKTWLDKVPRYVAKQYLNLHSTVIAITSAGGGLQYVTVEWDHKIGPETCISYNITHVKD